MKRPILATLLAALTATRERSRLALEALGAVVIVYGLGWISIPLAIVVVGICLVVIANFYMGSDDASSNGDDSADPTVGE